MKNKVVLDLTELRMSVSRARRASSAMFTFSALLGIAVAAADGDPQTEAKLPTLAEISNLYDELASNAEEASVSVDFSLQRIIEDQERAA